MSELHEGSDKHVILLALGTPSEALMFEQVLNARFPNQLEIYRAPSGFDAMSLAMNRPRVVLLDQRLPDVMGMDMIEPIREQIGKDNYLIFIGGSGKGGMRPGMRDESFKRGATAICDRPVEIDQLVQMIRELLFPEIPQHPHLHGLELLDLIQAYHVRRVSRTMRVFARDGRVASIYMLAGEISHIEAGAMQGFPAILDLMNWAEGRIEVYDALLSHERTNQAPTQTLILDAARAMDEGSPQNSSPSSEGFNFMSDDESLPPSSEQVHTAHVSARNTPPPLATPSPVRLTTPPPRRKEPEEEIHFPALDFDEGEPETERAPAPPRKGT